MCIIGDLTPFEGFSPGETIAEDWHHVGIYWIGPRSANRLGGDPPRRPHRTDFALPDFSKSELNASRAATCPEGQSGDGSDTSRGRGCKQQTRSSRKGTGFSKQQQEPAGGARRSLEGGRSNGGLLEGPGRHP